MGCRQADMSLPELLRPRVAVELSLRPASLQAVTRAADEGRITDTNLYLFGRNATFAQHLYATTGRLRFECPPGDYRLYVVANRHADLGERTEAQLAALTFDYRENYDDLPMSYVGEITVPATTETLTLPPVEVRRRVAKVACNISVGANAPDIVLKSVCLCNVPRKGRLFGEGVPPASAADYTVGVMPKFPRMRRPAMRLSTIFRRTGRARCPELLPSSRRTSTMPPNMPFFC